MGRTDAMRTDGFAEGVRRANLYLEAGADMVYIFPNNELEARKAPKEIAGPLVCPVSDGNRFGRPLFSVSELEEMGYKMVAYPSSSIQVAAKAVKEMFETLKQTGRTGLDQKEFIGIRKYVEETNLDRLLIIPGNHDITWASNSPRWKKTQHYKRFFNFHKFLLDLGIPSIPDDYTEYLNNPHVIKHFKDLDFLFFGLNSCLYTVHCGNDNGENIFDWTQGDFNKNKEHFSLIDVKPMEDLLKEYFRNHNVYNYKYKIAAMHHQFDFYGP